MYTSGTYLTRVRIPAYTGQDESGSCQNVYKAIPTYKSVSDPPPADLAQNSTFDSFFQFDRNS
jgi:hypothetical protein